MTYSQLGGWGISGQWNHSDFNSTLKVLIRQYASFPFFNLYVGRDPNEILRGTDRKYIQASIPQIMFGMRNPTACEETQVVFDSFNSIVNR
jgi:hypothetical protein